MSQRRRWPSFALTRFITVSSVPSAAEDRCSTPLNDTTIRGRALSSTSLVSSLPIARMTTSSMTCFSVNSTRVHSGSWCTLT